METLNSEIEQIKKILQTNHFPVGIKIIQNSDETWEKSFQDVKSDKRFCYYVRLAAQGQKFVIKEDSNLECYTPFLCLGFKEPKYADFEPRIKPAVTRAILIGPLHTLEGSIDSVVFVVNAKQAMYIVSALRGILKKKIDANFGASMAVCGEIVAHTVVNKTPNLSVLCEGARIFSEYADDELIFGIPFHLFNPFLENLKKGDRLRNLIEKKNSEVY